MKKNIITMDESRRLDAIAGTGTGPMFARQLEAIDPRVFTVFERELYFAQDIPVNASLVPAGAESYTWRQYDKVGSMKLIAGGGKDLPTVEIGGREFTSKVEQYGAQLEYTKRELEAALRTGMNLDMTKADAVRRVAAEKKNYIAYFGTPSTGKTGLLNDTGVTYTVAANGASPAAPAWSGKTALEMYNDCKTQFARIRSASKGAVRPNRMLLPVEQFELANTTMFNPDGTNITVRQQVEQALGVIMAPRSECDSAHTVAGVAYDVALMYESNPMFLEYLLARDLTRHPLQEQGLSILVPYDLEVVGTVIRVPMAFDIMYGI